MTRRIFSARQLRAGALLLGVLLLPAGLYAQGLPGLTTTPGPAAARPGR